MIQVARSHFDELSKYLVSYLAKGSISPSVTFSPHLTFTILPSDPVNSRSTAGQKLTRLTHQQFQELSTDVYDELLRRKDYSHDNRGPYFFPPPLPNPPTSPLALVPFLPVREDFHPKRNQARQKLATLPMLRFKDLSGDVYHELVRRYPEFKD